MLISFRTQIDPNFSIITLTTNYFQTIPLNGHASGNGQQLDNHQMHFKLQDLKGK